MPILHVHNFSLGTASILFRKLAGAAAARRDWDIVFDGGKPSTGDCEQLHQILQWNLDPSAAASPQSVHVDLTGLLQAGRPLRDWLPEFPELHPGTPELVLTMPGEPVSRFIYVDTGQQGRPRTAMKWVRAIAAIRERTGMDVVLGGPEEDHPLLEGIHANLTDLEVRSGLSVLSRLLLARCARGVVGGLHGIAPLATWFRIPTVLIYDPADAKAVGCWEPSGAPHRSVVLWDIDTPAGLDRMRELFPAAPAARPTPAVDSPAPLPPSPPAPVAGVPELPPVPDGNPWIPWHRLSVKPSDRRWGEITVVVPTAGERLDRLGRCLTNLRMAAGEAPLDVVVVLCPTDPRKEAAVTQLLRGRSGYRLLPLAAPFNFCRSVNAGVASRHPDTQYILLLNDDCYFQSAGLIQMRNVLTERGWAAIGPWINGDETRVGDTRATEPHEMHCPLVGTCVLWSAMWMDRVGPLDERFGEGWGLDEADYCLRAIRLGARLGRDDRVTVLHDFHGSFGVEATQPGSPTHQLSVSRFQEKYGPGVHSWGRSPHWMPMPGIHVAIAGHNVAPWLQRCLDSVEEALDGYRWILTFGNDASTDGTLDIALEHRGSADLYNVRTFSKASTAAMSKNRAVEMGRPFQPEYPALVLMDADDIMLPGRVRDLLWVARDGGHRMVHGAARYDCAAFDPRKHRRLLIPNDTGQQQEGWLHPCSTILHWSVVPDDGKLFPEDCPVCEDALLWYRWFYQGLRSVPVPGDPVHQYCVRSGSLMHSPGTAAAVQVYLEQREALRALLAPQTAVGKPSARIE